MHSRQASAVATAPPRWQRLSSLRVCYDRCAPCTMALIYASMPASLNDALHAAMPDCAERRVDRLGGRPDHAGASMSADWSLCVSETFCVNAPILQWTLAHYAQCLYMCHLWTHAGRVHGCTVRALCVIKISYKFGYTASNRTQSHVRYQCAISASRRPVSVGAELQE